MGLELPPKLTLNLFSTEFSYFSIDFLCSYEIKSLLMEIVSEEMITFVAK